MELSDSSEGEEMLENIGPNFNVDMDSSLNETAVSFRDEIADLEAPDDNGYVEHILQDFFEKQLRTEADFRFKQLQEQKEIFSPGDIVKVYPPQPLVYFLPYTILVHQKVNLIKIRDRIHDRFKEDVKAKKVEVNIILIEINDELSVTIRMEEQLVLYKIKKLRVDKDLHRHIDCLDSDLLVDRLFSVYKTVYKQFLFEEVSILFMYWAYKRNFLSSDYIGPSAIKVIIISLFIGTISGVGNILQEFKHKFWKGQEACLDMVKANRKGEFIVDKDILKHRNYTIEEKKGFYVVSAKKHQTIKSVVPVLFPIGERVKDAANRYTYKKEEEDYFRRVANENFSKISKKGAKLSRYRLLHLLFKQLEVYFSRSNKIVLDLKRKDIVFEEHSSEFFLQVEHPVLPRTLSKNLTQNGSAVRRIKLQLTEVMAQYRQNEEAIDNIRYLFRK